MGIMTKSIIIYLILIILIIGLCFKSNAQIYNFKCDGLYQTSDVGIKVINEISNTETSYKIDSDSKIIDITNEVPDYYIIDTIPLICFCDIKSIEIEKGENDRNITLSFKLKDYAIEKFQNVTYKNIGRPIPFIFENKLILAPIVNQVIENGEFACSFKGLSDELLKYLFDKFKK